MLRTFHVAQVWQKVSVFGSSCVMSLLSLLHSPRDIPTTLSSPPARPQHGAGVNPQAHPLAGGVRPTGRLVSTHKNDERSSSTRKLVANTQIIITCRRYSIIFTKEMEKVSNWCDVLSGILQGQRIDAESVTSMKAALHFGKGFATNSEIHVNTKFENIESVFDITQKLIQEQSEEILNVECLRHSSPSWERSMLANDQAIKWAKARVFVFADFCPMSW